MNVTYLQNANKHIKEKKILFLTNKGFLTSWTVFDDKGISFRFVSEAAGTADAGDEGDSEAGDILRSSGGGGDGGW